MEHYNDVIWARWRLKSPAARLFTQSFNRAQVKENIKAPRHWPCAVNSLGNLPGNIYFVMCFFGNGRHNFKQPRVSTKWFDRLNHKDVYVNPPWPANQKPSQVIIQVTDLPANQIYCFLNFQGQAIHCTIVLYYYSIYGYVSGVTGRRSVYRDMWLVLTWGPNTSCLG